MRLKKKVSRGHSARAASVDVHCHVFNSWDVPVRQFIKLVYLEKFPGGHLADSLVDFLELIMRFDAPTTGEEIDELKGARFSLNRLKPHGTNDHNLRAVAHALEQMWNRSSENREWVQQQLRNHWRKPRISLTPAHFKRAAQYLMGRKGFDLFTWIKFALIYTKPRWEITEQLVSLSATQEKEVVLYTPAMLDIGFPLNQGDTSDLREQVKLMSLISQMKGWNCAVHAFVAFDPFRSKSDPTVLDTVMNAVQSKGAIGVKIYPPMGFKPCGNYDSELNRQMKRFLDFCLNKDVPIMAHCCFSQFVTPTQGACAAPEAWHTFLKDHKALRLNLGHCGGPWDIDPNQLTSTIWTKTVIELLGCGDYPNLYADVADDSFILEPGSARNRTMMKKLRGFLNANAYAKTRLLYGSDWSLLARESGTSKYYERMKTDFCQGRYGLDFTDDQTRGFLGGNALRFLGLAKNPNGSKPKNRVRLENFRSKNGLDMSIFSKIDAQ